VTTLQDFIEIGLILNLSRVNKLEIFEEPEFNNPKNPTEALLKLTGKYILVTSDIKEHRKILYKYTSRTLIADKSYFIIRLSDNHEVSMRLRNMLSANGFTILRRLTITGTIKVHIYYNKHKDKIPQYWNDRIPLIEQELNSIPFITYKYKKENNYFPMYIRSGIKAENFVNYYEGCSAYNFFCSAIYKHVITSTGVINSSKITKVIASTTDIRKLLPTNLTLKKFLSFGYPIEQVNKTLIFTFYPADFEYLKTNPETGNRNQILYIPLNLLHVVFKNEAFGKNGLKYFLLIILGYRMFYNPTVQYKPSTIIKLANINDSRSKEYTLQAIERPLAYLKQIGVIDEYSKIDLESDTAIKIRLKKIKSFKLPKQPTNNK